MAEDPCPLTCPNRKGDGLNLFGWHIDPIELLLYWAIVFVLVVPAVQASARPDYTTSKAAWWIFAIVGSSTAVRMSPTDRINAYLKVMGKNAD